MADKEYKIEIIEKPSITVIGKMGQGSCSALDSSWIQDLWDEANEHFSELGNLVEVDKDGNFSGFWGLMSDIDENFLPWDWQGKYLAGCEVKKNSIAPNGWTKWVLPSFRYLSVYCNHNTYYDTMNYVRNDYMPKHKYKLVAAIQEYYSSKSIDGSFQLLFPIEVL